MSTETSLVTRGIEALWGGGCTRALEALEAGVVREQKGGVEKTVPRPSQRGPTGSADPLGAGTRTAPSDGMLPFHRASPKPTGGASRGLQGLKP